MKDLPVRRAQSEWALPITLSAVTLVILGLGLLGLWLAFTRSTAPRPAVAIQAYNWHNSEVLAAFYAAGLPADVIRRVPKDERDFSFGGAPVEATPFQLGPGPEQRGMIFHFEQAADLERVRAYYVGLGASLPQYRSWLFVKDNVLLQINGDVPQARAEEYAEVLEVLGGW